MEFIPLLPLLSILPVFLSWLILHLSYFPSFQSTKEEEEEGGRRKKPVWVKLSVFYKNIFLKFYFCLYLKGNMYKGEGNRIFILIYIYPNWMGMGWVGWMVELKWG